MASAITGVCVVDKKSNCPPNYTLIERTLEGEDADLWKDGLFRSRVTRYICYTKDVTSSQWNHVVTDLRLIGLKDFVPQGYTGIRETIDTKESALRKHTLCVQFKPRNVTNGAIVDMIVTKTESYKAKQYTSVGEMNGINVCYKLEQLLINPSRPPPPVPRQVAAPLASPPPVASASIMMLQSPNTSQTTTQPLAGIEGVPFKLHESLQKSNFSAIKNDLSDISIKTKHELEETFNYDFTNERKLTARQN